jgi:CheY-like chemotaxis protein
VASGREGLAVIRRAAETGRPVDIVILDYQMPSMDGGEVARTIRADKSIEMTPIVMLTSVDQAGDGSKFSELGVQSHLIKPARASMLLETIIATLQNAGAGSVDWDALEPDPADGRRLLSVVQPAEHRPKMKSGSSGFTILVAEDNEVNQIVIGQILAETGHAYLIVDNGERAVEQFKAVSPDLILMDVSMPEMNGLDATQAIRGLERDNGGYVPIIGLTAHALKNDRDMCIDAGMDDYVPKPVSVRALNEAIEKHLNADRPKVRARA